MALYATSSCAALAVEPNRFSAVALRAILSVVVFGIPLTMAFARIHEAPHSIVGWSRLTISLAAVAIVVLARRRNFARRLLLAFALEAASGVATLVYVDVPFVEAHANQIANHVAAGYGIVTHRDLRGDVRALPIAP